MKLGWLPSCYKQLLQTDWLQTRQIFSLPFLEFRSLLLVLGAEIRHLQGCVPSGGAQTDSFLPFPVSRGCHTPWLVAPSSCQAHPSTLCFHHLSLLANHTGESFLSLRIRVTRWGWTIQKDPISGPPSAVCTVPLAMEGRPHIYRFWGLGWDILRGHHPAHHGGGGTHSPLSG